MTTFGEFLKEQRKKRGLNQNDFGNKVGVIMTDISKIENGRKRFPFANLDKLAELIEMDYDALKEIYVGELLAEKALEYNCSDNVFIVAESKSKYLKQKNAKQMKLNL